MYYTASELAKRAAIAPSTACEWIARIMGLGIPAERLRTEGKRPKYTDLCSDIFDSLGKARDEGISFEAWAERVRDVWFDEFPDVSPVMETLVLEEDEVTALVPLGDRQEFLAELVNYRSMADQAMDLLFADVCAEEAQANDRAIREQRIALDELKAIQEEEQIRADVRQKWEARKRARARSEVQAEMDKLKGGKA